MITEYNKVQISKNKVKSVVCRWVNIVTSSSYVGNSMVINKNKMLSMYYVKTYKHKSIIYSAILKYDLSIFSLKIIEYCNKLPRKNRFI